MGAARLMNDASDELEIITELHSPIAVDPSESGLAEDGLSRPTHSDADSHTSSKLLERRNNLRVETQLGHVRVRPPAIIENSDRPSSSSTTSEVDADETRSRRLIRSVISLPSFHLPNRARPNSYRDRHGDTPPLTSASLSSLTGSGSPISSSSGLYTPPHSPPAAAFVHTEITSPSSHLPAIIELPNTEDRVQRLFLQPKEVKSTQTLTRTERPKPSSSSESDGQGQPRHHMYRSNTASSTGTVTGLPFPSPPPTSDPVPPRTQQRQQQQLLTPLTRSPSPTSLVSLTNTSGRGWPFGGGRNKSRGVAGSLSKEEKAEMKKRKKAEARAHKEQLALELKRYSAADEASVSSGRSNERILNARAWEEDIAVYGSLASM